MDIKICRIENDESKQKYLDEKLEGDSTLSYIPTYLIVKDITIFLAAFSGDKCIGIIDGYETEYSGEIDMFMLSSEYKNTEVGKLLLGEIENYFKVSGKNAVSVYLPELDALERYEYQFFKNNGYVEIEVKDGENTQFYYWLRMIKLLN
jgi:GNAT superfamily N-acetyltransferase